MIDLFFVIFVFLRIFQNKRNFMIRYPDGYSVRDIATDPKASLMDYSARWYSPDQGRFTTRDTWTGDIFLPQTLNRYAYTLNNPLKYSDPTGHVPCYYDETGNVSCGYGDDMDEDPPAEDPYEPFPIPEEGLTWEEILQRAKDWFNSQAGYAPTDSEINRWIAEQIEFFKKIHSSPEKAINYWTLGLTTPFFEAMKHDISTKEYWINYGEAGLNLFTLGAGAVIKQGTKQGIDVVVTGVTKGVDEGTQNSSKIFWGAWDDYSKVTVNGQEYAQVGNRLYTRHAVERMQPSGNRYGSDSFIIQAGNKDYGRSVAPRYVEDVIQSSKPVLQENGNLSYSTGSLQVITNQQEAVITIITK